MKLLKGILMLILLAIIATGTSFVWAYKIEPSRLVVREKTMRAAVSEPVKVVFWTDLHLGMWYPQEKLVQVVEKINAQQPDLVIFGGDFFDHYAEDQAQLSLEEIAAQLQKIEAPLGKYAVWGNHDYGGGSHEVYPQVMEAGGFTLLKNEQVELKDQNLRLYGLDDPLWGNAVQGDFSGNMVDILITHEPDIVDQLEMDGVEFAMAGHSHGGQVRLPVLTEQVLPPGGRTYVRGWYDVESSQLLVSGGIGMTKLPLRFGCTPEICAVEILPLD